MKRTRISCLLIGMALMRMMFVNDAHAQSINVAVASNFTHPIKALIKAFEKQSDHNVRVSFGSSGKFYAQIKHGAPFQVFLSADQTKPLALEKEGLVMAGSRFTYAIGRLAIWSSKENFIDERLIPLKNGHFNKLALANPKLAPYGVAAAQVLDNLKLTNSTQSKWVQGENIAQTYQFVSTGNSDLGFVALSQIIQHTKSQNSANTTSIKQGSAWVIPNHLHRPIRQDAVLLKRGKDNQTAYAFMQFLKNQQAKEIINTFGYETL